MEFCFLQRFYVQHEAVVEVRSLWSPIDVPAQQVDGCEVMGRTISTNFFLITPKLKCASFIAIALFIFQAQAIIDFQLFCNIWSMVAYPIQGRFPT